MTHKLRFTQPFLDEFLVRCRAENLSGATILWCRERLEMSWKCAVDLPEIAAACVSLSRCVSKPWPEAQHHGCLLVRPNFCAEWCQPRRCGMCASGGRLYATRIDRERTHHLSGPP